MTVQASSAIEPFVQDISKDLVRATARAPRDTSFAKRKLAEWKRQYDKVRPHTSLGNVPPSEFAEQWIPKQPQEVTILNPEVV